MYRSPNIVRAIKSRRLSWAYHVAMIRIFGPMRDANGEKIRLHNEEIHRLYRSRNIIRVIMSRRLRWAGRVAKMEEDRSVFKIVTGKLLCKTGS